MNDKLAKILNKAREVKMTIEEKSLLKSNIMSHMEAGAFSEEVVHKLPKKSPYVFHSLFAKGMVLAVVIIVIASGGVSFAANSSLPGEILYTIKVNINEKIKELTLRTPEEKIAWYQEKIAKRLSEINSILDDKEISKTATDDAEKYLDQSIQDLKKASDNLPKDKTEIGLAALSNIKVATQNHPALAKAKTMSAESPKDVNYTKITDAIENKAVIEIQDEKQKVAESMVADLDIQISEDNLSGLDTLVEESLNAIETSTSTANEISTSTNTINISTSTIPTDTTIQEPEITASSSDEKIFEKITEPAMD